MGLTKSDMFTEQQNLIANYARVLGHPARVAILQHLFAMNACVCGELVLETGLAQPTVSQHLKELKSMGLIKGSIEGTSVCYCIDEGAWNEMKETLGLLINQQVNQSTGCC